MELESFGRDPAGTKKQSQDGVMQGSTGLRVSQTIVGSVLSEAEDPAKARGATRHAGNGGDGFSDDGQCGRS